MVARVPVGRLAAASRCAAWELQPGWTAGHGSSRGWSPVSAGLSLFGPAGP